ncbi:hypothetical protein [Streptacidiphilus fuscans]|uniref:Uncharacterized protein n=1 Tax=Streptacidiphilus fuscans TaxID=2789292 RepID=A0A931FG49_9ACTN|nr:hypothetical protein [Streptacidiphilus fuscans]MBF9072273.1 hypothetical protein [Streptacidiphilus fuscans]
MSERRRLYRYVGPADLRALVRVGGEGFRVVSAGDFERWAGERSTAELAEPFTFAVGGDGVLRLAARRSEHVVCAGGEPVFSAGEMRFAREADRWAAAEVSNQSTGYCPDVDSWPAVADALVRAGIEAPEGFTHTVVFRRCPACGELHVVREDDFVCVFCEADLPLRWNVDEE